METIEVIAIAESLLPQEWGKALRLNVLETYENATTVVVRCSLSNPNESSPSSVAVKHVRPHPENPTGYLHSFLNDWAACIFLNSFEPDPPLAPRFYGGDIERSILIMEDLGGSDGPDTMALLDGSDPALAEQALVEDAALIGQLHRATAGGLTITLSSGS